MIAVGAVLLAAAALGLWLYLHHRSEPNGWSAGPIGYSAGVIVDATGSFDFPQAPRSVHYVTRAGSLAGKSLIRLRYRIEADPSVEFHPVSDPAQPSIGPTLYFQRKGDDWSGEGEYETYRWWATFASPSPITAGEHEVVAPLSAKWTAVETSSAVSNPSAFAAALDHSARIGFTFGGGTGYGHGVYATGKARFVLLGLDIE